MADSQMDLLFKVGRFNFYWAERGQFLMPGVHVWTGGRHRWLFPVGNFSTWPKGVGRNA